ncbi:hypothetical protein B0H17DRAFT_1216055 [Mycena rosella]|uniref:Adhesin domain-containing protein n=1 Tax=Mycena rosella TaxID=1033263 RepID=A0AAD7CDE5_MYCRO|nr:hypothetical protein B0H17DRAFT_1216055 [Mycena rosella]
MAKGTPDVLKGHTDTRFPPSNTIGILVRRGIPLRRIVACLVALGLLILVNAWLDSNHLNWGPPRNSLRLWPAHSGIVLDHCVWGPGLVSASTAAGFEITLTAETKLLLSRSIPPSFMLSRTALSGKLDITTSPHLKNMARVIVNASSFGTHAGADIKVCLTSGIQAPSQRGVNIFINRLFSGDGMFMNIRLILPEGAPPLHLKSFIVGLPEFAISMSGNLGGSVTFDSMDVRTSNAPVLINSLSVGKAELHTSNAAISADSITCNNLMFHTTNGAISGSFNTSGWLALITSNASINATVGLSNVDGSSATRLSLQTNNGNLNATISIATAGNYVVHSTTSNGPLALAVPTAPRNGVLTITASTSNARAEVGVPAGYEGAFAVSGAHSGRVVHRDGDDARHIEYASPTYTNVTSGWVYTEEAGRRTGSVSVTAFNSSAVLVL